MANVVQQRFESAMARLAEQLKKDDAVLAVVLCGSLSHDQVWDKSDIDLVIVAVDDPKKVLEEGVALVEDEINVHASVLRRESFRRLVESSRRNSFLHSFVAKGRLLFSKDDTLARLFDGIEQIGERDRELRLMSVLAHLLPCLDKARKWAEVKHDYAYAALFVLQAASALATIEVTLAGELAGREVLQQALRLNSEFFRAVYLDQLGREPSAERLRATLLLIESYLLERRDTLFGPLLEHLSELSAPASASELEHHFTRHLGLSGVVSLCEWLADQGLIVKTALPRKVTARSSVQVQELAFAAR